MSREKRVDIPGGYLAFPHRVLKAAVKNKLSGSQWRALTCCVYQYIGNEKNYSKGSFKGGLSVFMKYGNMTKGEAFRAVESLVDMGLIEKIQSHNRREPAEYRLNLDGCENTTVAKLQPLENDSQEPDNGCKNTTVTVANLQPSRLQNYNHNGCKNTTLYRNNNNNKNNKHFKENKHPPSPLGGEPESIKSVLSGESPFFLSLKDSRLSGGSAPLPPDGTPPEKKKPNPKPLISLFEEETGLQVNLTLTEFREFRRLMAGCNQGLFQSEFLQLILKTKEQPVPEKYKRPGDYCMLIARGASVTAKSKTKQLKSYGGKK